MKLKYFIIALPILAFLFSASPIVRIKESSAAGGDVQVIVTRQGDDAGLVGALVEVECSGGVYAPLVGSPLTDGGGRVIGTPDVASSCDVDEDTIHARVSLSGYVTTNNESGPVQGWYSTSDPNELTITGVQFGFAVLVNDELGNSNTVLDIMSFRGANPTLQDPVDTNKFYWADTAGANASLSIQKDGYVAFETTNPLVESLITTSQTEQVLITLGTSAVCGTSISASTACKGLEFGYKYPLIRNELNTNLNNVTLGAGATNVTCAEDAITFGWYCPIPIADGIYDRYIASKDGYVHKTNMGGLVGGARSLNTDPQVNMGTISNIQFSHKFITKDELGNNLTLTSATAGASSVDCAISTNTAYCPILLADDNTLSNGLVGVKDGYVTTVASAVPLAGNRTLGTTAQQVTTMTTTNGLDFAVKVAVSQAIFGTVISGATVTSGDALAISCSENGSTGTYYCSVPVAHTGALVSVVKSGYTTSTESFTDRTASTDAQASVVVALAFPSGGGKEGVTILPTVCSSVTYGEWQSSCVNGLQYRTIFPVDATCTISTTQREAAQRSCTDTVIPEAPLPEIQNTSSPETPQASLLETITSLEKKLSTTINTVLSNSLLGRILLQIESHGESWYLNPLDSSRYYMSRPLDALNLMRRFALGVNNIDMQEFLVGIAPKRLSGRILLNVEDHGKAYYVNPLNLKLYYLGSPEEAYTILKSFGLGISNLNLRQIKVGS